MRFACLSGLYISMGVLLNLYVAGSVSVAFPTLGKIAGGLFFPVGLMLVCFTGAELFTGNCMILPVAFMVPLLCPFDL